MDNICLLISEIKAKNKVIIMKHPSNKVKEKRNLSIDNY